MWYDPKVTRYDPSFGLSEADWRALSFREQVQVARAVEAERAHAVVARGAVPVECGPDVPVSPARGPVVSIASVVLVHDRDGEAHEVPGGWKCRNTPRVADVFDVMGASAKRAGRDHPLSPGQIAMGRSYRDMVERYESAGVRGTSLETRAARGSSGHGSFIDGLLQTRDRIETLRFRIGSGVAMDLRRVRPSARGSRVAITDRRLVDMVCLEDQSLTAVLVAHGWVKDKRTLAAVRGALVAALDRMAGPMIRRDIEVVRF